MTQDAKQPVAPVPGTPEYDASMAKRFDDAQAKAASNAAPMAAPAPEPAKRPEHVPEKFWDATKGQVNYEAWNKSTAEAEKRLTEMSQQQAKAKADADAAKAVKVKAADDVVRAAEAALAAATDDAAKQAATAKVTEAKAARAQLDAAPAQDAASQALESKGLDMNEFQTEFAKDGKLSDTSYEKLEKAGIPKAIVDQYIAGQHSLVEQVRSQTFSLVGGEENYGKMAQWAAANLQPAELNAYNQAIEGTKEQRELAVNGMYQKYTSVAGRDPKLLGGNNAPTGGGYQSIAQMTADMKDPRYSKDPAFRAEVERKVAATTAF